MFHKAIDLDKTTMSLQDLLDLVELEDTQVILMRAGQPVAVLSPVDSELEPPTNDQPRVAGLHTGTTWVSEDFDDPIPDEVWMGKK